MKLKFSLLLICLFCIGLFSEAQTAKKKATKPATESNVEEEIPVTVTNTRRKHHLPPPPPPPIIKKDKPQPPPAPPKVEKVKFVPPVIKKDRPAPPPPPPAKPDHTKLPVPPTPETPPVPEDIV
ncbi:MAG: hypothetical protein KGO92_01245 [Bacteroidota bacterium]|nr:hypothetical protein [Bacteroidota bacterium]